LLLKQEAKQSVAPVAVFAQLQQETESPLQQLEKLSKFEEADVITEEEFQEKKKDISQYADYGK
jgi:hypothetical protein